MQTLATLSQPGECLMAGDKRVAYSALLRSSTATTPDPLSEALKSLIRSVLREELEELRAELLKPVSEYRDRNQEAARLGISLATLDRLCRDGLPFVYVGDSRRFRAREVDDWLSTRRGEVK